MLEYISVGSWWLIATGLSGIILCIWVIRMYNLVDDKDTIISVLENKLRNANAEVQNYSNGFNTAKQQRDKYYKELMEYKMVLGDD